MSINCRAENRTLYAAIDGELDHHRAREVLAELDRQIDLELPLRLTLDLGGVTFMDSSGIAVLLRAWRRMNVLEGTLRVIHVPQQAERVLKAASLDKLMELEQQGEMELVAGDCLLRDTDAVLDAEEHYTVCHYVRCRHCGALYFMGACVRGTPVFRQVEDLGKENLSTRLWGRCGTLYSRSSKQ